MKRIGYSNPADDDYEDLDFREEFNLNRTPYEISEQVQNAIDNIISSCPETDWNEDLISFKLIERLREILSRYKLPRMVDGYGQSKFNLEAYKLTGKAEQTHGDIAFIITKVYPDHTKPISGVAFYEAKAARNEYYSDEKYPSFCIQQLRRLVTHTPKLNYLIYTKKKQHIGNSQWPAIDDLFHNRDRWGTNSNSKYVSAFTIDANFLKQCRDISQAATMVGLPFGSHFVNRVLSGRDLDYSRPVNETIKRWLKYTKRAAPLIVSISVHNERYDSPVCQLELPGFELVDLPKLSCGYKMIERK
ncbi:hypothetical protein [Aliivibrio fischeri]|uniref:hypothetical protein n=1 Tax=Aliivibrio fischeri TaxID=668 RepID=UPI0012DA93B6|nr:hypothetical protein [Aliivibrio fischeri]MUL17309.1 hypothetical protein [Aliivibrio fischeri]